MSTADFELPAPQLPMDMPEVLPVNTHFSAPLENSLTANNVADAPTKSVDISEKLRCKADRLIDFTTRMSLFTSLGAFCLAVNSTLSLKSDAEKIVAAGAIYGAYVLPQHIGSLIAGKLYKKAAKIAPQVKITVEIPEPCPFPPPTPRVVSNLPPPKLETFQKKHIQRDNQPHPRSLKKELTDAIEGIVAHGQPNLFDLMRVQLRRILEQEYKRAGVDVEERLSIYDKVMQDKWQLLIKNNNSQQPIYGCTGSDGELAKALSEPVTMPILQTKIKEIPKMTDEQLAAFFAENNTTRLPV